MDNTNDYSKDEIEQIKIEVEADGRNTLWLAIRKDGGVQRQSYENPSNIEVAGIADPLIFQQLIDELEDAILDQDGVYNHPQKLGREMRYSLTFIAADDRIKLFEFHVGDENTDVGELMPYVNDYIQKAMQLTDDWYFDSLENVELDKQTLLKEKQELEQQKKLQIQQELELQKQQEQERKRQQEIERQQELERQQKLDAEQEKQSFAELHVVKKPEPVAEQKATRKPVPKRSFLADSIEEPVDDDDIEESTDKKWWKFWG